MEMIQMKCEKCGEELGVGDEYELLTSHIGSCNSKEAKAFRDARDDEDSRNVTYYDPDY